MNAKGKRAALYLRISKDDARTGLAVERQRSECMDLIEREGLTVVKEYADNGVSAYARNVSRPAFDAMTLDYESGRFDVVVCWDLDRFSRQPAQLEHWIELGESRGLQILTPTETTDLGTDNGRMFARMKAAIARAEVERKSARQRAQVKQAKEAGTFRGRVGFNDPDVIKRIYARLLAGDGPYQVAKLLNVDGLKTLAGLDWSGQAVRRVAKAERHRGTLITVDDWDRVQTLLERGVKVGAKEKGRYSGVARCVCGSAMTASGDRYVCAYATNHPGSTGHVTVLRKHLEPKVDQAIALTLTDPDFEHDDDPMAGTIAEVDARIRDLTERKEDILSGLSAGLTMKDLLPHVAPVTKALEEAESIRQRLLDRSTQAKLMAGLMEPLQVGGQAITASLLLLRLQSMDPDKRRDLARAILDVRVGVGVGAAKVTITKKKRKE